MVQIEIADLKEGNVETEIRHPSADDLDLDSDKFSDIELTITLQKFDNRLEVAFDAAAVARLQGDRTLEWYNEPLSGSFAITFKPPKEYSEADQEDEAVRKYSPTEKTIDLTQEVRDTILLSLPLRQIAPGGEEQELDLTHGEPDGEHVPEWKQKLQNLQNNGNDEGDE